MKSSEIGDLHISQFNSLFDNSVIENVVYNTHPFEFNNIKLIFEKIEIQKPIKKGDNENLYPAECREQNLTYGGNMYLKIKLIINEKVYFNDFKFVGTFPIMIKSNKCNLHNKNKEELRSLKEHSSEPGGYFIINGHEKLIRFHIAHKRNYLFKLKNKNDKKIYIRTVGEDEIGQKLEVVYTSDGNIFLKCFLNRKIFLLPIVLILRSLKNISDEEVFNKIKDNRILNVLDKTKDFSCFSQNECLYYLGNRFKNIFAETDPIKAGKTFISRILTHLKKNEDKLNLLFIAIKDLYLFLDGKIKCDDLDSTSSHELYTELQLIPICIKEKLIEIKRNFLNKIRSLLSKEKHLGSSQDLSEATNDSEISSSIYRTQAQEENSEVTNSYSKSVCQESTQAESAESSFYKKSFSLSEKAIEKIVKILNTLEMSIGNKLFKLFSSGNITNFCTSDLQQTTGFTLILDRINFWRYASHFHSVNRGSFFGTLKITTVRKLRPESFGFLCPVNTPDGSPCGLLIHLTKNCFLSSQRNTFDYKELYAYGVVKSLDITGVEVFYNGKFVGKTLEPLFLYRKARELRTEKGLEIEVVYERGRGIKEQIRIEDDVSRMMRRVEHNGKAEAIGVLEQVYERVSLVKEKDVLYEKSIMNMFSTVASCISFADYNPSPRNMYQCQMSKQAMSFCGFNVFHRNDNKIYFLNYLQNPIVRTADYSTFKEHPIGFNCIVAVISYTAYDMEDAVIINKASVQKGLFNGYIFKTKKVTLEKASLLLYTPEISAVVCTGDCLARYLHENTPRLITYSDNDPSIVHKIRVFESSGCVNIVFTFRIVRVPQIGDKFCSRHGQKGVCSMFYEDIDMPFTEKGLKSDIIINPHAFPSRMTIGMLLESMCGKSSSLQGFYSDSTPFLKRSFFSDSLSTQNKGEPAYEGREVKEKLSYISEADEHPTPINVGEELRKCDYNFYGNEPMYSGVYGNVFDSDIFIGVVYYQRLRHMVNDKYQFRTSGAIVSTTHQPVKGRKNNGGIRFGEMERDGLIAHGTSNILKDRLMNCSDGSDFIYCVQCKSILFTDKKGCACKSKNYRLLRMPYVFKYLCCELMAMNIKLELEV